MRHDHDRLARPHVTERVQNRAFGEGIQRRRGFVDDEEACRAVMDAHQRACAVCVCVGRVSMRGRWDRDSVRRTWQAVVFHRLSTGI